MRLAASTRLVKGRVNRLTLAKPVAKTTRANSAASNATGPTPRCATSPPPTNPASTASASAAKKKQPIQRTKGGGPRRFHLRAGGNCSPSGHHGGRRRGGGPQPRLTSRVARRTDSRPRRTAGTKEGASGGALTYF